MRRFGAETALAYPEKVLVEAETIKIAAAEHDRSEILVDRLQ
jgi:hypothetical protein